MLSLGDSCFVRSTRPFSVDMRFWHRESDKLHKGPAVDCFCHVEHEVWVANNDWCGGTRLKPDRSACRNKNVIITSGRRPNKHMMLHKRNHYTEMAFRWKEIFISKCVHYVYAYLSSYPVYFRESHWLSIGLPEISRVTWQVCIRWVGSLCNMVQKHDIKHSIVKLRWRHNGCDGVSNHQPHHCLLNHRLFRRRSKKTSKLRVTGLCAGNSPGTGEFPAQMASYAENVSIWWRHHDKPSGPLTTLWSYKRHPTPLPHEQALECRLWAICREKMTVL